LASLETLMGNINAALELRKKRSKEEKNSFDIKKLKSELAILEIALEDLDAGTINKSIDLLMEFTVSDDIGNDIQNISDSILIGEYEQAAESVKTILKELRSGAR
jgi:hypothetical protein